MLANWITLSRLPLLAISILALFQPSPRLRLAGVAVLLLGLFLDTIDGIVARKRQESSLFGSVLDIAADRAYELAMWVCFAYFRLIPVVMPILVIARTTLTDALRSLGVRQGAAPFEQHRTPIGRFLVGSPVMKIGYSVTKIAAFTGLGLAWAFRAFPPGSRYARWADPLTSCMQAVAWLAVTFCVVRGLPVIVHGVKEYWGAPAPPRG
ncbi:MAG: CDP-alcohol phosphatidyltransferase family protein [Gemmatimonadales bacterium]